MKKKVTKYLKFLALIALGVGVGYLVFSDRPSSDNQTAPSVHEVDGITVNSENQVDKKTAENIVFYTKDVIRDEFLPQEMKLRLEQQEGERKAYVGGWVKNARLYFVLYAPREELEGPSYFRAWYIGGGEEIERQAAVNLLEETFEDKYSNLAQGVECSETEDPERGNKVTQCASVEEIDTGEKVGVTVRAPYVVGADKKSTIVFACYIPEEGAPSYTNDYCI